MEKQAKEHPYCNNPWIPNPTITVGQSLATISKKGKQAEKGNKGKDLMAIYPCGSCRPCRERLAWRWVIRNIMETDGHNRMMFATLTYNDDKLPKGGNLITEDLTKFIKRLRFELGKNSRNLKYFACGEYGPETIRPHYHIIIYGIGFDSKTGAHFKKDTDIVEKVWGKGHVHNGRVTQGSIAYTVGYVLKSCDHRNLEWFQKMYPEKTQPEFRRMSKNLGVEFTKKIAKEVKNNKWRNKDSFLDRLIIPVGKKQLSKEVFLPQHLANILNEEMETPDGAREKKLEKWMDEVVENIVGHSQEKCLKDQYKAFASMQQAMRDRKRKNWITKKRDKI